MPIAVIYYYSRDIHTFDLFIETLPLIILNYFFLLLRRHFSLRSVILFLLTHRSTHNSLRLTFLIPFYVLFFRSFFLPPAFCVHWYHYIFTSSDTFFCPLQTELLSLILFSIGITSQLLSLTHVPR